MIRVKHVLIAAFTALMLGVSQTSHSKILEVGASKAYVDISTALTSAIAGDAILVYPGTYIDNLIISKSVSLTSKYIHQAKLIGNITVKSTNVTIDGFSLTGWTGTAHGIYAGSANNYLTIRNNLIDGNHQVTGSSSGIYVRNATNLWIDNNTVINCNKGININAAHSQDGTFSTGAILSNNRINNNPIDGIDIQGEYISIYGNVIDNNMDTNWTANHPDGIQFVRSVIDGYSNVKHVRVYNNIIRNHTQNIFLEGYSDTPISDVDIFNNILYNDQAIVNGVSMDSLSSVHIKVKGTDSANIYNNYFGFMKGAGQIIISTQGTSASAGASPPFNVTGGVNIKNNIFNNTNTASGNYAVYSNETGNLLPANLNNNLYSMANLSIFKDGGSGTSYTSLSTLQSSGFETKGLVSADPKINALPFPEPRVGSPAIDKGTPLGVLYAFDFKGLARPQGGAPDIGPFEFRSIQPKFPDRIQIN
jgi:hypothetical protein